MPSGDQLQRPALELNLESAWPAADWNNLSVVVAVSGGPDSIALLRAIAANRPESAAGQLIVAHFNHRWRGADSNADEVFVADLAAKLGFRCEVGAASHAAAPKKSEESARKERYAFLQETAHRLGARYVAVAHTLDDQAETILFRLLRGTGLSGLTGMPSVRPLSPAVTLIRPLLGIRRPSILAYLESLGQPFRIDVTNADLRFARNRLRHEVIPQLQQLCLGDVTEQLAQLGIQAAELLAPVRTAAATLLETARFEGAKVRLPPMTRLNMTRVAVRELFVEIWRRQGWPRGEMNFSRWEELTGAYLSGDGRTHLFPGNIRASWGGDEFVVNKLSAPHAPVET